MNGMKGAEITSRKRMVSPANVWRNVCVEVSFNAVLTHGLEEKGVEG
jgi:hypothetical protein